MPRHRQGNKIPREKKKVESLERCAVLQTTKGNTVSGDIDLLKIPKTPTLLSWCVKSNFIYGNDVIPPDECRNNELYFGLSPPRTE